MHFHVHASAEGPDFASDIFSALDQVDFWLDAEADSAFTMISYEIEQGDFESACENFTRSQALENVHLNIRNVVDQWYRSKDRAPLYSGADGDSLLIESAQRIADRVNSETDFGISECSGECITLRTVTIAPDVDLAFVRYGATTVNVINSSEAGKWNPAHIDTFMLEAPESDLSEAIIAYLADKEN